MCDNAAVIARLRGAGCFFAEQEARLLTGAARTPAELSSMVSQREQGLPLEQIVGWAEFTGLRILVGPGVFVPRRRSEFLVQVAAGLARQHDASPTRARVLVDLCCGTGALGLAVASELAGADPHGADRASAERAAATMGSIERVRVDLHAADLDPAAVACARWNVEPAGGRVYVGDLFDALPPGLRGRVDVLICNAPYVPSAEIAFLPAEARDHEPLVALDGGLDGLAVLRRAAGGASGWLAPGGVLLVETSELQGPQMATMMAAAGLLARVHRDEESGATVVTGQLAHCGVAVVAE